MDITFILFVFGSLLATILAIYGLSFLMQYLLNKTNVLNKFKNKKNYFVKNVLPIDENTKLVSIFNSKNTEYLLTVSKSGVTLIDKITQDQNMINSDEEQN